MSPFDFQLTPFSTPAILFTGAFALALASSLLRFRSARTFINALALVTLCVAAWYELSQPFHSESARAVVDDATSRVIRLSAIVAGAILVAGVTSRLRRRDDSPDRNTALWGPLILFSIGGVSLCAGAIDLAPLFVGLSLAYAPLFLVWSRASPSTARRGALTCGFALATLLFGLAILYAISGATHLVQLKVNLSILFLTYQKIGAGLIFGMALSISALAALMCVAPFHLSLDDTAKTTTLPLTGWAMMIGLTGAGGVALRLCDNSLIAFSTPAMAPFDWGELATFLGGLTLILSAAALWRERSLDRMLVFIFSTQAALALITIATASVEGVKATLWQIGGGSIAAALVTVARGTLAPRAVDNMTGDMTIDALAGWGRRAPLAAVAFCLALMSLAALPYTVGFGARSGAFTAAIGAEAWAALSVMAINAVVVGWRAIEVVVTVFRPARENAPDYADFGALSAVVVVIAALTLAFFGAHPDSARPLLEIAAQSFSI